MSIEITGIDKLEKRINKMTETAESINNSKVNFNELFTTDFMNRNTDVASIDQLVKNAGYTVNSQEDFEAIPEEPWDKYVNTHTKFSDWHDMISTAGQEYVVKKLHF